MDPIRAVGVFDLSDGFLSSGELSQGSADFYQRLTGTLKIRLTRRYASDDAWPHQGTAATSELAVRGLSGFVHESTTTE